ncbi:1-phosphofructokinase [Rossellomorea vietnamensis]|uniref:Tagatose-6-phosphate kinase n=1 Tax=Rossellomorea vietnamensis TaxID=218284 RepID=A0A5D4NLI8_9BACI|nr:1-phosphofructokinase [Rossellomorea vietnamensis]TYS13792.1 1-phosphofructokinase [Rossellomorea vietnamensis]
MIYTLTLNPSIDYFVTVGELNLGETNRMEHEDKAPGGKGINVSRVLTSLGIKNKALGFIGGFTGQYILEELRKENIDFDFVRVETDTRINIKLRGKQETEINGIGPEISSEALGHLTTQLEVLQQGDTLVLAGSIPSSMAADYYEQVMKQLEAREVKVVVDTTNEKLMNVLKYRPFLIKPNHHELGDLFDVSIDSKEDAIPFGKKLVEMGARNVIVSMGGKGTLYFSQAEAWFAPVPPGKLVNSVGAGDSVVAGFVAAYEVTGNALNSFKYGAAAGSATAYSSGFCTEETIEELLKQIEIEPITGRK